MEETPREPVRLDYAEPAPRRPGARMKWVLFTLAVLASLASADTGMRGLGGPAAGLWVAFAIIYVQELKSRGPSGQ